MIIMLARPTDPPSLGEPTPTWALQGGNDPRILIPVLNYISVNTEVKVGETLEDEFEKEEALANWCQFAEERALEVFPDRVWNASHVFFFEVPSNATKVAFFKGLSGEELAVYWLEGDSSAGFRLAKEISINSIYKFL